MLIRRHFWRSRAVSQAVRGPLPTPPPPSFDSADRPRFGADHSDIRSNFRAYLTPPPPVATYYGLPRGVRSTTYSFRGGHPSDLRARATSGPRHLPGPTRHSAAMLHSQVAGEGHNNKEFAP